MKFISLDNVEFAAAYIGEGVSVWSINICKTCEEWIPATKEPWPHTCKG